MKTILRQHEANYRDLGSKFLGYLFPCEDEEQFNEQLTDLKSAYPDATHHCYAYRIDPNNIREFSSDDGEPSGTAGLPILNQLKSSDLVNAGIVVIRYFGGTKLGKSGLIQAYGETAGKAIDSADLKEIKSVQLFRISYSYSEENLINKLFSDFSLLEQNAEYTESVTKTVACPAGLALQLKKYHESIKHLGIELEQLDKTYMTL